MRATLRAIGVLDLLSGLIAVVDAAWLGDQLGVSSTAVRIAGVALVVLGVDNLLFTHWPALGTTNLVVEAGVALAALDLAVLGDPTAAGTALLAITAVYCTAVAVRLAQLRRTSLVVAAQH